MLKWKQHPWNDNLFPQCSYLTFRNAFSFIQAFWVFILSFSLILFLSLIFDIFFLYMFFNYYNYILFAEV